MKVYVDELPKICKDCNCLNRVNGRCQLLHLYVDEDEKQEDCPLQLLADHDKKVRAEVVEENQELKARWEKLKTLVNDFEKEYVSIAPAFLLEKIKELEE